MARNWAITADGKLVVAGSHGLSRVPGAAPPPTGTGNYSTPPFPPDTNTHPVTALDSENFDDHEHLFKTLVPASAHTKFAGISGSWSDGLIWDGGVVPGAGDKVWIPQFEEDGVTPLVVTYDVDNSTNALAWVRVSGHLTWSTTDDTSMLVHLLVTDPTGTITMGTRSNPIPQGVTADILFPSTTNMSVASDARLLGRGFVSHGTYEAFGAEKTTWLPVSTNPSSGATTVTLSSTPTNWQIGDVIVIGGTRWGGWSNYTAATTEDEVRRIKNIVGATVTLGSVADETVTQALSFNHDSPRADLKTKVANYSRNITFATQGLFGTYSTQDYYNNPTILNHRRGHVMGMHSHSWDSRFVAFHELGRTRKGGRFGSGDGQMENVVLNSSEIVDHTTNIRGRYSLHFHRTGHGHIDHPAIAFGCAVWGSPGWGAVHHDGNGVFQECATFNCHSGFVAETANEVGQWIDNIAIRSIGEAARNGGWQGPKAHHDSPNDDILGRRLTYGIFDLARNGSGFWFQGRAIHVRGCVSITSNGGFDYFHRGRAEDRGDPQPGMINYRGDPANEEVDVPDMVCFANGSIDEIPIRHFDDCEAFACLHGITVEKADHRQRHDFFSVLSNFTAWRFVAGAGKGGHFSYTGHYLLLNFDLVGNGSGVGIETGNNALDFVVVNPNIENVSTGVNFRRAVANGTPNTDFHFGVVGGTFTNISGSNVQGADFNLSPGALVAGRMNITLTDSEPLTYSSHTPPSDRVGIPIRGTKHDSAVSFVIGLGNQNIADSLYRDTLYLQALARHDGYYTSGGTNKGVLPIYWSDTTTGRLTKRGYEFDFNPPALPSGAVNLGVWNASPSTPTATNQNVSTGKMLITSEPDGSGEYVGIDKDITLDSGFDSAEQPKHGRLYWSKASNIVRYRPDIEFSGTDSFDFWTRDQQNFTRGTITITVS